MEFFAEHEETLRRALAAIASREYWSPYPESPRAYSDDAPQDGEQAFQDRLGRQFELDQPSHGYSTGGESSPYGVALDVSYPVAAVDDLVAAAQAAMQDWGRATVEDRVGVCLEILDRLKGNSFEMAHAVMQTTGQAFLMAFQAGGPHALDRGLEAVAYAYSEMTRLPGGQMRWEKPQGKRDPLQVDKQWRIRPRGVAVTIGVSTFPTWNGYPGIFASLATGNPVIVKPHPGTILPLALFVATARTVLAEAGFDPNTVLLAVDTPEAPIAKELVMRPEVGMVDYTGGSSFGSWLEANVTHALVFTEKAGVNSVVVDSAEDLKGVFRNLSVSLTMYSGQMCTTPQNVYIPADGIRVGEEHATFDDVAGGLAAAIAGFLSDDQRAGDILGSIKSPEIAGRIADAAASGEVLLESREVTHPNFPAAEVRTPVIVQVAAANRDAYMREMFGPVIYVVATSGTEESLRLAKESAQQHGAITWLVYTTDEEVMESAIDAAVEAGVSVAFNLDGGLYVNQSAAFSDFHVTGANPAGNASLTDAAFVAGRFRVVGVRISA
ncbi:MAG: phenylacetic acid degradation protein PaaN [Acidimicrobiia bacterium]|nr:phenylacetic acid degradation protein PaaN [Acidimicrobiia bacterium]